MQTRFAHMPGAGSVVFVVLAGLAANLSGRVFPLVVGDLAGGRLEQVHTQPVGHRLWADADAETVIGELKAFLHPENTQLLEA